MKKWKKRALTGVGILIVAAITLTSLFKAFPVDTVLVKKGDVTSTVVEKGKVISVGAVDIVSEVQGKITTVHVDEGDEVEKGALLAVIDIPDVDARIAQLEGELKAIQGSEKISQSQADQTQIKQQQLALEQATVAFDLAKSAYWRTKELHDAGAVTISALEQAKAEMETRQKFIEQSRASLESLRKQSAGSKMQFQGQIESVQAQLSYLRKQKEKSRIVAEKAGQVFSKRIKQGDFVSPGTLLLTVGVGGESEIETYLNSKDIVNLRKGQQVSVLLKRPGNDLDLIGLITRIAPAAEERISSLGIIEDKIKVVVQIKEQPKGVSLTTGTAVDVTMVTQEIKNALNVPKETIFSSEGKHFVWVNNDGKAHQMAVKKGIEGDETVEIIDGLKMGQSVILNPNQKEIKENVKLKLNNVEF